LPINSSGEVQTYFLGYIHGERYRSRALEFSTEKAPNGREDIDYQPARIHRSENLLSHLEYALFQTTQATLSALAQKRISARDMNVVNAETCDHIARRSPALARNMRFDLDVMTREIMSPRKVATSSGRMPASFGKPTKIFKQN